MLSIEDFNSIPKNYVKGAAKFIIVTGSVISGVGKGVVAASIARLLEDSGLKVLPFKFDGYLNINAGTLSPFRHGEVFVLDDGLECDMDLGTYERFLNTNLSSRSYLTNGTLMKMILNKEEKGEYLGRDVQYYPHVSGEIKKIIRERVMGYDTMIIEVGGTVGDDENAVFIGAVRELIAEEGKSNVTVINITYILEPPSLGEQKSKPAQLGIKELMRQGLYPDIIIARSENPISEGIRKKLSNTSNLSIDRVYCIPDLKTIYEVPLLLKEHGIMKHLGANESSAVLAGWKKFVNKVLNPKGEVKIMIAGKYTSVSDSYASIIEALKHAGAANDVRVNYELVETTDLSFDSAKSLANRFDGLIVPGGFGTRGVEGKINAIRAFRESNKPFLGLCYGMQLAVIEFGRNVCGLNDANTTEINGSTLNPIIFLLPEQHKVTYKSGSMRLGAYKTRLKKGTQAFSLYGKELINERFRHRYEVNPAYVKKLEAKGMIFSGESSDGLVKQIIELSDHNFFMASQFHPELTSKPLKPNPLFKGFIKAAKEMK
ncbi:MAG: CTP synthase (glutamine hydrolyzing) [Candidatus Nanoarchaeia archaeon]|jgi:CTP synthase